MTVIPTMLSVFVAIILMISITGCSNGIANTQNSAHITSLYDRVMQQGKIRCAYVIYPPACIKDPNTGKLSGIGIDTLNMVAKNLGLQIEWTEEVGWGSMVEGLQTNRYDMLASLVWTNSNRARIVDFSKPLYYSPICAYVKAGSKKITANNLAVINSPDYSIATIDGETAEIIAREDFPKAKKVSLPQLSDISQVLLTVSSGKADLALQEPAAAAQFIKNNPGAVCRLETARPIRVFPNCWMFKRGQMEFKNMIDTALSQLVDSGAVDKIISKYEPAPNTLYRVASPYQTPTKGN